MLELLISKLPQRKRSQLHQSAHQPPIYLTVEGYHYDQNENAIVYLIEIGLKNEDKDKVKFKFKKLRYSILEKFNNN
jgi:hypothetical protein